MLDPETEMRGLRRAARRIGLADDRVILPMRHRLATPEVELAYVEWPAPAGADTIVLLHGGRLTARTWDLVCLSLRDTYRCIALDQRGHGDSGWSADGRYAVGDRVGDLERLLAHVGVRRYALVGHSLGGIVAATFASQRPAGLGALVIVDTGPHAGTAALPQRIRTLATRTADGGTLEDFVQEALAFAPGRDPESLRYSLLHNLRDVGGKLTWKYDPTPYAASRDRTRYADRDTAWERVGEVAVPTLVVHGADSDLLTDEEARSLVARLPRGELLTIPGAGHSVQGDKPREMAAAIRSFVGRVFHSDVP